MIWLYGRRNPVGGTSKLVYHPGVPLKVRGSCARNGRVAASQPPLRAKFLECRAVRGRDAHACPSAGMGILAFGSRAGAAACQLTVITCPGPIGHQRHTCKKGASGTSWDSTSGFLFLASSQ